MKNVIFILALALSINVYAQDDKTVTLVVSGSGTTEEVAKQNALRSAIEQAFGTFISSETIINNDSFVSDNITLLSQGSVISFNILSSNILPDNIVDLTLSATVSISQMQKITKSEGHSATIAGGLFGMNLKLLKLQADAEEKVIRNMVRKSLEILENSIDFTVEVKPPRKSDIRLDLQSYLSEGGYSDYWPNTNELSFNDIYKLRMTVECRPNSNLDVFIDYFLNTLSAIKMSDSEVDFTKQSGSEFYKITLYSKFGPNSLYLRNKKSLRLINFLFEHATLNLFNYDIVSDNKVINYTPFFKNSINDWTSSSSSEQNLLLLRNLPSQVDRKIQIIDSNHYVFVHGLLSKREMTYGIDINKHYPADYLREYYLYPPNRVPDISSEHYNIKLFNTTVSGAQQEYCREQFIYFSPIFNGEHFKTVSSKNNMNLRLQVFDIYLPLSDVEKLNEISIVKHEPGSVAK